MPVPAYVELELNNTSQVVVSDIAQDVFRFNDPAQVGECLSQPVRRKSVGQVVTTTNKLIKDTVLSSLTTCFGLQSLD